MNDKVIIVLQRKVIDTQAEYMESLEKAKPHVTAGGNVCCCCMNKPRVGGGGSGKDFMRTDDA